MSGGIATFALYSAIMVPLRVLNEYPLTPEPRVNRLHVRQRVAHTGVKSMEESHALLWIDVDQVINVASASFHWQQEGSAH